MPALPPKTLGFTTVSLDYSWPSSLTENKSIFVGGTFSISDLVTSNFSENDPNYTIVDFVHISVVSGSLPTGISLKFDNPFNKDAPYHNPNTHSYGVRLGGKATTIGNFSFKLRATIKMQWIHSIGGVQRVYGTWIVDKTVNVTVSAASKPPIVAINAPTDGDSYTSDESVSLSGTATGFDGANYTIDLSSNISWSSDLDGVLGSGATFLVPSLTAGSHVITATCNDAGDIGTDSINLTVTQTLPISGTLGDAVESLTLSHVDAGVDSKDTQTISVQFYAREDNNVNGTYSIKLYEGLNLLNTLTGTLTFSATVSSIVPNVNPSVQYEIVNRLFHNVKDSTTYTVVAEVDGVEITKSITIPDRTGPLIVRISCEDSSKLPPSGTPIPYRNSVLAGLL